MPCEYYTPAEERRMAAQAHAEFRDKMTRLLCEACEIIQGTKEHMSRELTKWYRQHREDDRKREAEKQERERMTAVRESALARLSEEERLALGVK